MSSAQSMSSILQSDHAPRAKECPSRTSLPCQELHLKSLTRGSWGLLTLGQGPILFQSIIKLAFLSWLWFHISLYLNLTSLWLWTERHPNTIKLLNKTQENRANSIDQIAHNLYNVIWECFHFSVQILDVKDVWPALKARALLCRPSCASPSLLSGGEGVVRGQFTHLALEGTFSCLLFLLSLSPSEPILLLKTRQQAHNRVAYAKCHLNYSLGSPRNWILNQSMRNCLISYSYVIWLTDPCHPQKEPKFTITNWLFCPLQLL